MDEYTKKLIEKTIKIIKDKSNPNRLNDIENSMNELYKHYKSIIKDTNFIDKRLIELFKVERLMKDEFLPINSTPIYQKCSLPNKIKSIIDIEKVLNYIVYITRNYLNKTNNIYTDTLEKKCLDTSFYIEKLCNELGINVTKYSLDENLGPGVFHSFIIVNFNINNESYDYIIDCTYRQFFTYSDSFLERIGVPYNSGASLGKFMILDEKRKEIAEELLQKGYILATDETIKAYLDGFVFSGRNGKYYESLNKNIITKEDYEPSYTTEDYIYAINNSGLKEKNIGRMNTPLTKDIDFREDKSYTLK